MLTAMEGEVPGFVRPSFAEGDEVMVVLQILGRVASGTVRKNGGARTPVTNRYGDLLVLRNVPRQGLLQEISLNEPLRCVDRFLARQRNKHPGGWILLGEERVDQRCDDTRWDGKLWGLR